jgi:hypothetical protein
MWRRPERSYYYWLGPCSKTYWYNEHAVLLLLLLLLQQQQQQHFSSILPNIEKKLLLNSG